MEYLALMSMLLLLEIFFGTDVWRIAHPNGNSIGLRPQKVIAGRCN